LTLRPRDTATLHDPVAAFTAACAGTPSLIRLASRCRVKNQRSHAAEDGNPGLSVLAIEKARGIENSIE
jgi:hypothetical protein